MGVGEKVENQDFPEVVLEWLLIHPAIVSIELQPPQSLRLAFFVRGLLDTRERSGFEEELIASMEVLGYLLPRRNQSIKVEWLAAEGLSMIVLHVAGIPERRTVGLWVAILKRRFEQRLLEDGEVVEGPVLRIGTGMNRPLHGKTGTSIVAFRAEGGLRVYHYGCDK